MIFTEGGIGVYAAFSIIDVLLLAYLAIEQYNPLKILFKSPF
jgi:hypothetical protein